MNDICEMWSLPWHALHKSLALGLAGAAVGPCGAALKPPNVHGVALSANSWLSRVRRPQARLPVRSSL
jgi:hypothetical protein